MYSAGKIQIIKKTIVLIIVYVLSQNHLNAQTNSPIHNIVMERFSSGLNFEQYDLFNPGANKTAPQLGAYQSLTLNRDILQQLKELQPDQFQLSVPLMNQPVILAFVKSKILDDSIKLVYIDATGEHRALSYDPPVFYHGIIKNNETSSVTASVTPDAIHISISYKNHNIQISAVNDKALTTTEYGVFENLPGNNAAFPFTCGTNEGGLQQVQDHSPQAPNGVQIYGGKVIRCFFDCSYTYFLQNGSTTATYNRITTLFNQAALLYANEQVNTSISEIRVWTGPDPYDHSSRVNGLASFKLYVKNSYTGNLAMLCDYTTNTQSGLADAIGGLCVAYNASINGPYIYNDLNYNNFFVNFPVAADAPQTYLIIHEIGHILGSHHTQWCGWSGGPIDNCFAVEGSCSAGPTPTQGTMMSYCCINSSINIDFNAGFGPQPGNTIRSYINGSACIGNGTTVCDSSLYLQGSITNSDYTRFEVSNQIISVTNVASNANVLFDAGKTIFLKPGFIGNAGSIVRVLIEGCGGLYSPVKIKKISIKPH